MTADEITEMFENDNDEFLKFEHVPAERQLNKRPDICAFLLLDKLVPGDSDIVAGAEHDEIYLEVSVEDLAKVATEDDILTLIRCGVRWASEFDCLAMFV